MSYLYMTNRYPADSLSGSHLLSEAAGAAIKPLFSGGDSVFRAMKRIYAFLDEWKASHPDTSLLLTVDQRTAKIVNSYFHEMSENDYEQFAIKEGEVVRYPL